MTRESAQAGGTTVASAIADSTQALAGATGTRVSTFSPSAQLVTVLLALKPAQTSYGYDSRGNRTSSGPAGGTLTSLSYNLAGRLTGYGSAATYTYDGDGLRASKTASLA